MAFVYYTFIHQWLVCDRWSDITFFFSCLHTATTSFFQFTEPGSYEVFCTEDPSLNASVQVVEMQSEGPYKPLLYTHAALMGITFGILLPLGAFLAHHQVHHPQDYPTNWHLVGPGWIYNGSGIRQSVSWAPLSVSDPWGGRTGTADTHFPPDACSALPQDMAQVAQAMWSCYCLFWHGKCTVGELTS